MLKAKVKLVLKREMKLELELVVKPEGKTGVNPAVKWKVKQKK